MDTMISVWTVVEHVRVASGAAELAIFTAILYWFFTSSRVADMLEVVGERVGGWCGGGRDTSSSLRQAMRARRRQHQADMYAKLDDDNVMRTTSLYRVKEGPVVPAPQPQTRPQTGLACRKCAPLSRESWHDPKTDTGSVINILDIGRQTFANGGVVSRYLCDLAQCFNLTKFDYKDVVPNVEKDPSVQSAIEATIQAELEAQMKRDGRGDEKLDSYDSMRRKVEARAKKVILDISSAMSNNVLRFVAWVCHKAIRRVAGGGCGSRAAGAERLRRANAAGLPLVFVPLHRSHFDYILVTFALYLTGIRPPLVAAGDNMRIPFFGWFLRGCGAFYIRRRVDGSEYHGDPIYKSALRAYILNSLAAHNNLEFFIEGGRTRTGKPQPPKAGILSVIMDAYLDGTIDDALLVPVTLNYDRLVDGNFVREQLGMPKQMETFWSALRGIWRTLNTNHGMIRVDFNQPISLKEMVTSFQQYNHFKSPVSPLPAPPRADLATSLDRQILYNNSNSSLYGADVSADHKMMVEAIGRHLVYDAAQATALMSTNLAAYVLLTERRGGCSLAELRAAVGARASRLAADGRDLYSPDGLDHALDMLGRGLVIREGKDKLIRPQHSIAASLELSYYANSVVAHYAAPAILATALECEVRASAGAGAALLSHGALVHGALQLAAALSAEFVLSAPCTPLHDCVLAALDQLRAADVIADLHNNEGLEEEQWSRRFARRLEEEEEWEGEGVDPVDTLQYRVRTHPEALAERRRLVLSIRPLIEAYAATCRCLADGPEKVIVKKTLDSLIEDFTQNKMVYGEAVSTDAIRNCLRLLRQWGVLEVYVEGRQRMLRVRPPYRDPEQLRQVCSTIYKFNDNFDILDNAN